MGYVYELIDGNDGGGGSGQMESAANYSALPPAATETGFSWFVEASQGTAWLPGSLGGTYFPRGVYYSNGAEWLYQENPGQATQSEVIAGIVSDKWVSPETLKGVGFGNDKSFTFTQAIPATIWTVNHNLGKFPSVTVTDNSGEEVEVQVTHVDNNNLNIDLNALYSGKAYIN